nr:Uncharacterised protein [Salmonella enterica subsp. enterica serovar Typhi]
MLLIDQIIRQRQIVGNDLYRLPAHFAPQQESGGAAVNHYALTRVYQLRRRFRDAYFFIVVLRLVQIHRRPAGPLLGNGLCAVAHFFKFSAFVELVDVAARRRRGDSQTLNHVFDGNKAQLCQHIQQYLMSLCFSHELFRYKLI